MDAPPPSQFKVFLISLWGALLFTAFDVCWIYLDYYRDVDLTEHPEYLTQQLSPNDIMGLNFPLFNLPTNGFQRQQSATPNKMGSLAMLMALPCLSPPPPHTHTFALIHLLQ